MPLDTAYAEFLAGKRPAANAVGLDKVPDLHCDLMPHQRDCVAFGLRQGRFGLFLDTGLGKTFSQLEWARHSLEASNGKALILAPLAVAAQIVREGKTRGYEVQQIRDQTEAREGINVCNYDRLNRLDFDAFGAVSLDESSILKSFTGKTTRALIGAFRDHRFRCAATATPAPNDHMELGQHSDFLGVMRSNEMLMRWFIADQTEMGRYRLKGHAEASFWDWMASWCRMAETPADFGYDASAYNLPPLNVHRHRAAGDIRAPGGLLFAGDLSATTLHETKRRTANARAKAIAALMPKGEACVVWCDTDYEADAIRAEIPEIKEVRGSHPIERKEETLEAFASGQVQWLLTKPSVAGFGMNWQHCATIIFAGRSFSYEAWYQAVRRSWRFGQKRPVECHLIVAEGEDQIGRVIDRKGGDHKKMKQAMSAAMRRAMARDAGVRVPYQPMHKGEFASWIS